MYLDDRVISEDKRKTALHGAVPPGRNRKINKEKIIIFLLSVVLAGMATVMTVQKINMNRAVQMQEHLAQEVLRFHILANSDSKTDQSLKMAVKEDVLEYLEQELPQELDVDETKEWMRRHTKELETVGQNVIQKNGFDYPVSAAVTTCYFPEKTYGDVTFPKGNYEALRIEIGAAKGHNWWCVLYPNLCFTDAVCSVVPEEGKQKLKNVLTEEEYAEVTASKNMKIKWYFQERMKS